MCQDSSCSMTASRQGFGTALAAWAARACHTAHIKSTCQFSYCPFWRFLSDRCPHSSSQRISRSNASRSPTGAPVSPETDALASVSALVKPLTISPTSGIWSCAAGSAFPPNASVSSSRSFRIPALRKKAFAFSGSVSSALSGPRSTSFMRLGSWLASHSVSAVFAITLPVLFPGRSPFPKHANLRRAFTRIDVSPSSWLAGGVV